MPSLGVRTLVLCIADLILRRAIAQSQSHRECLPAGHQAEAFVLGGLNKETQFVLEKFKFATPPLLGPLGDKCKVRTMQSATTVPVRPSLLTAAAAAARASDDDQQAGRRRRRRRRRQLSWFPQNINTVSLLVCKKRMMTLIR